MIARLLYRDGLVLIIDKPAGLAVHKGPGGGPTVEDALDALRFGLPRRPALAHRLDRDTSGCLVLGRHAKALRRLGRLFAQGRVGKTYWAVVEGVPADRQGRIALPLRKRSTAARGWWMETAADGQNAVTEYRVLGMGGGRSWLELTPLTGRTHQIRVHLAAIGHPVVGDAVYGHGAGAMALHARAISLPLYPNKPAIAATAPVPAHMAPLLEACGWTPDN
ncbi:MAG: RNA pseudouridine synthase [Alphaproteobacteria bacterium]|nr:MAG: RNA pseudouridine synthase [Alphaproteobacteria bacterium]